MKKVLTLLLVAVLAASFAFAAEEPVVKYSEDIDFTFQPTLTRFNSMGQSGLADPYRLDSFYSNPAALPYSGFGLSLPSVSFTLNNVQKLVSDEETMAIVNKIAEGSVEGGEIAALGMQMISNLGKNHNNLGTIDMALALKLGSFGLGTNAQVKFHSLNNASTGDNIQIIPEINLAQTVALGLHIIDTDVLSLSAGVSGHAVFKAYMKGMGASEAIGLLSADDAGETLLWDTPIMGGYALPVDVGVSVGLFDNLLNFSATANNLNGTYKMKSYTGAGFMVNSFSEGAIPVPAGKEGTDNESVEFEIETPWTLNFGFAFDPGFTLLNPVITADLVDMLGMVQEFSADTFKASDLLLHLNVGAEVDLLGLAQVRAGVNRGYMSVGAGFGFPGVRVDASYGWQEFGLELGDKPVDSFTVKFNIGYDK